MVQHDLWDRLLSVKQVWCMSACTYQPKVPRGEGISIKGGQGVVSPQCLAGIQSLFCPTLQANRGLGLWKPLSCALRAAVCRSLASPTRVRSPQHRTSMWEESKKGTFLQGAVYSGWRYQRKKTRTEDTSARRPGWRQATQSGRQSRGKFIAGVDVKTPGWE